MNDDLERAGGRLYRAREALAQALAQAQNEALKALDEGVPETVVARALGVDRMTIRKWAGKR